MNTVTLHINGKEIEVTPRRHPWATVAGARFKARHLNAFQTATEQRLVELAPGVLNELMRVMFIAPHHLFSWEHDVPMGVIEALIQAHIEGEKIERAMGEGNPE